ncbi:MAG: hypothetical protein WC523_00750 [Patescibacteria group bacterium]
MSFIKIGDEIPILDYFDDNGKECYCPECGKKLKAISITDEENELVCDCEIEKSEELN